MVRNIGFEQARDLMLDYAEPVSIERVSLEECAGRILAQDVVARESVPAFDRSPYDGYAFRAVDSACASEADPVILHVLEEVAAGDVPKQDVTEGTAIKILTGAPIPRGADAVVMYEKTKFTETEVSLTEPVCSGDNIVRAGEDILQGELLAEKGSRIDCGIAGTLSSQGETYPQVYRRPRIGLITTGNEVVESDGEVPEGKIRNTNRYTLAAEVLRNGCEPVYIGQAGDAIEEIADLIEKGLETCDALLLTGGVSVGDYDLTPAAMERAGVHILVRGVGMKPGMACAYGEKDGKTVYGLSGNPASALTGFYAVAMPVLRKMTGRKDFIPQEIMVTLADDFPKKSRCTRLLRGRMDLSEGTVKMHMSQKQGNVVISSAIGCDVLAIVPAGSGPLSAGAVLKGFLL